MVSDVVSEARPTYPRRAGLPRSAVGQAAGVAPPSAPGDLGEDLAVLASPAAAIMEAYARIEAELRRMLEGRGLSEIEMKTGAARLAHVAARMGLIPDETVRAVEGIGVLRNLAAHGHPRVVSREQALDYLLLADSVLYALRNPARAD